MVSDTCITHSLSSAFTNEGHLCREEVNYTYPANSFKQEEERRDEKILCTKYVYCFNAPFFFANINST